MFSRPPRPHDLEVEIQANHSRSTPMLSGYRPSHDFGNPGELNDGLHEYPGVDSISPGSHGSARIWLLFPERQAGRLWPGMPFNIQEGNRVVGQGKISRVVNEALLFAAPGGRSPAGRAVCLLIHEVSPCTGGAAVSAVVRCAGDVVQLGDVFTELTPQAGEFATPCQTRIEGIVAYGKRLSLLDPGLTAKVHLSGPGVALIRPGALRGLGVEPLRPLEVAIDGPG